MRPSVSVDAGGQHEPPRAQRVWPVGPNDIEQQGRAIRPEVEQRGVVTDRKIEHIHVASQVFGPVLARDLAERRPYRRAATGLEPCAKGEAGHAEIRAGLRFRRSQDVHARGAAPQAHAALRRLIQNHEATDALAHEPEGDGQTAEPGTDDDHVKRTLSLGYPVARRHLDHFEF